jgi:NodT family efflux transporter outer membrane factor (OMF) lipoprotein
VREARSQLYPTLGVSASISRSSTSGKPASNLFSLPFDVSWEPDLWGRIRNTVHQSAYAAQVSAADLENQKLVAHANLAVFFFELRGQDALQELYRQTVETDKQSLEITRVRYTTGIDNEESVTQAEITLSSAEAAATNAEISRAQFEHAIALLLGQPASSLSLPARPLTASVPAIPVGVPSQMLQRRPDIAAAERTVAEANALIGVGKAAYYPSLGIGASAGFQSSKFGQWLTWPSRFWSVGPTFSQTILDGGLRRATVAQYTAQYNAAVANYRQVVLTAFQQAEDLLASTRLLKQQVKQQQQTVNAAQRYLDLASTRYTTGLDAYLNVFAAQQTLLSNQQALITVQVEQMTNCVQLIESLGGGWDASLLPSERQVSSR